MVTKLTKRQKSILDYIEKYAYTNAYPPTLKEIADKFKITIGTVQDHIAALQKKSYLERVKDVARGFRVIRQDDKIAERIDPSKYELIPLYGSVAAGEPVFVDDNVRGYISHTKTRNSHQIHFALKVKGDSMIDSGIYDGDIVIVRKQDAADDGDIVIALLEDEVTVKTLKNSRINAYLEASNSKYKAIINRPFSIIGKVIELRRQYNLINAA